MIGDDLGRAVADALGRGVAAMMRLGGGDVAESYRVDLSDGATVFAKTHRSPPPGFFTTEATSLTWLREPATSAASTGRQGCRSSAPTTA